MPNTHLSNIELYYSPVGFINNELHIHGEDYKHIVKVMRHSEGDTIYVTDGKGSIFEASIINIDKSNLSVKLVHTHNYNNEKNNYTFCLPKLKNPDRFEFALEKCVELGITNFIIYESKRSVSKGDKSERWNKILIAAMKQSLRSYLPDLKVVNSLKDIISLEGEKIAFEQNSTKKITSLNADPQLNYYFIFGPEGGLDKDELELFLPENIYKLTDNRLRSETAIITAASLLH